MKTVKLLFVSLLLNALAYAQNNQSAGNLITTITPVTPSASSEIFRFRPGLVTQLQSGTGFGTSSDQWFSIGQLIPQTSGSQTVYGLRFQLPNRALLYGYQDIADLNPRVQWIGGLFNEGDLEFRFADDFTSQTSNLIASMTHEGQFILPSANTTGSANVNDSKMSVDNRSFANGLKLSSNFNGTSDLVGMSAVVTGFNFNKTAVRGTANGGFGVNGSSIAIEGISSLGFAGFFNGNVTVTGTFSNPSDRKLKTDITPTENALENISQLNGYTYTYKDEQDLNLAKGLQHGLIAQEVELVYPELVEHITYPIYNKEDEFEGTGSYKSVNYMGLIAELTEAIKTLNTKVEALESQLEPRVVYEADFSDNELDNIERNSYQLSQNTPNPFSSITTINYALPEGVDKASVLVLDLNGKLLKTYDVGEQRGQLNISAKDLNGAGMYLYTLYVNGKDMITKRMLLK